MKNTKKPRNHNTNSTLLTKSHEPPGWLLVSMGDETILNIYKASRSIKKRDNSLYNALCSIFDDSIFVGEIAQLWPELPVVANLRCGLWYFNKFEHTCYFKSTDGHTNNLSFNTSRLNLHLALLAGLCLYFMWRCFYLSVIYI